MKRTGITALLVCLVLVVSGCGIKGEESLGKNSVSGNASNSKYGSKIISMSIIRFETINPILNTEPSLDMALRLLYDSLFEVDENDNLSTLLASSYTWSYDKKTVNITIKDNVKWHDGSSLTAQDVEFTINMIKGSDESPYAELVEDIVSARATSQRSISIELSKADTSILRDFIFPIIPKHRLEGLTAEEFKKDENNLVGSGMYKITDFQKRKMIILERNDQYYAQKPDIEKLRLVVVPDKQAQNNLFTSREIDFYDDEMFFEGKYGDRKIKTIDYFSSQFEFLAFNMGRVDFQDAKLREACISAMDREKIVKDVYLGKGEIAEIPISPSNDFYDKSVKPLKYDISKAKEYVSQLNKAGANTGDEAEKQPFVLLVNMENDQRVKAAYTIKNSLEEAGIDVQVVEKPWEEYISDIKSKNYDMVMAGWKIPLSGSLRYCLYSNGDGNILGYSSEKVDALIDEIEASEEKEALAIKYSQLQKIIRKDVAYVPLVHKKNTLVVSERIEGVSIPSNVDIYRGIQLFSAGME